MKLCLFIIVLGLLVCLSNQTRRRKPPAPQNPTPITPLLTTSQPPLPPALTINITQIFALLKALDAKLTKLTEYITTTGETFPNRQKHQQCMPTSNLTYGTVVQTLKNNTNTIRKLIELPNGLLASFSANGALKLWNLTSGVCEKTIELTPSQQQSQTNRTFLDAILLENGNWASVVDIDNIGLWDLGSSTPLKTFAKPTNTNIDLLLLNGDGNVASIDSKSYQITIWNPYNGNVIRTIKLQSALRISTAIILPNGNIAIGNYRKSSVQIWNVTSGQFVRTLTSSLNDNLNYRQDMVNMSSTPLPARYNMGLTVLANGNLVSTSDSGIVVWNTDDGEIVRIITYQASVVGIPHGYENYHRVVALGNGGLVAVASTSYNVINIWNVEEGTLVKTIDDKKYDIYGGIEALIVLKNGNLASSYYENESAAYSVKIWNTAGFC